MKQQVSTYFNRLRWSEGSILEISDPLLDSRATLECNSDLLRKFEAQCSAQTISQNFTTYLECNSI